MGTAYVSAPSGPAMMLRANAASLNGAGHRADVHEPEQHVGPVGGQRYAAVGGLQADDAAVVGRLPDRPSDVASDAQRRHSRRDRRGLAAAGPARSAPVQPGVLGAAEHDVVGLPPQGELGHVRLADDDGAGVGQPSGPPSRPLLGTWSANSLEPLVVRRPAVSTQSLTVSGTPCSGPILSPVAAAAASDPARAVLGAVVEGHDGVEPAVDVLDTLQMRPDDLDRRELPVPASARPAP